MAVSPLHKREALDPQRTPKINKVSTCDALVLGSIFTAVGHASSSMGEQAGACKGEAKMEKITEKTTITITLCSSRMVVGQKVVYVMML